ncbi:TPA: S8 family serine peptidase, partial [Candidatus Woesearchaeota archaeon]|nr:S8 family serine peptidase [Candidatus Woesearchaeota archaeon]
MKKTVKEPIGAKAGNTLVSTLFWMVLVLVFSIFLIASSFADATDPLSSEPVPPLTVENPQKLNDVIIILKEDADPSALTEVAASLEEHEAPIETQEEVREQLLEEIKEEIGKNQEDLLEVLEKEKVKRARVVEVKQEFETLNSISAVVDKKTLQALEQHPLVEAVVPNIRFELFLDKSVPQIRADAVHNLSLKNISINGSKESVCVIDSGINASHPDLKSKIIAQQCYCDTDSNSSNGGCCPNGLTEDTNASDALGHGTHVSGIVGAHGNLSGVAKDANLVAVKVFGSSSSAALSDVLSGIDYCINQSTKLNISVITMSLGTSTRFSDAASCNEYISAFTDAADTATQQGIGVFASAGNSGDTGAISLPGCLGNVTSVGASGRTDDTIQSFSNRASFLGIFAPGSSINSTAYDDKRYTRLSGTSMAAPHGAGASALLQQYRKLKENKSISPKLMRSLMQCSGKKILDTETDTQYARLDVYNAVQVIDHPINYSSFMAEQSTNFSALTMEQLLDVENASIGNAHGKIQYAGKKNMLCLDLDKLVSISNNNLQIDLTNRSVLNASAVLTLFDVPFWHPDVLLNGEACPASFCTNKTTAIRTSGKTANISANLSFTVPHFDGGPNASFSTTANSRLSIFDQNDAEGGNQSLNMSQPILFSANYSTFPGQMAISNASCNLSFAFDNSTLAM